MTAQPSMPAQGKRIAMSPRERAAAQAYASTWRRRQGLVPVVFGAFALIGALLLLVGIASLSGEEPDRTDRVLPLIGGVLLLVSLPMIWLVVRHWRRIDGDLARGEKVVFDSVVSALTCMTNRGMTSYALRIAAPPRKRGIGFRINKRVFEGLREGEAVRCAYLPDSRLLLAIESAGLAYTIDDADDAAASLPGAG